jgi:hypothetical protein
MTRYSRMNRMHVLSPSREHPENGSFYFFILSILVLPVLEARAHWTLSTDSNGAFAYHYRMPRTKDSTLL